MDENSNEMVRQMQNSVLRSSRQRFSVRENVSRGRATMIWDMVKADKIERLWCEGSIHKTSVSK